ncbi:MAG: hypothetical protein ACT4TC_10560 [Myxococcaceae bacterium]
MAASGPALARPYRAMVVRTADTVKGGNLELGLRYQGFILGEGRPPTFRASPYHQLALHGRWGILRNLELETQLEGLLEVEPSSRPPQAYFGDIPIGIQWTFLRHEVVSLGLYGKLTLPTGPGYIDVLPPTLSDGTFDVEGQFIFQLRPTEVFTLVANAGFAHLGTRIRDPRASFDVPEVIKYGVAGTLNLGSRVLLALEVVGHSFLARQITPVWNDNQHLVEVIPGARFEIVPRLVLEAALGISVSQGLREIYMFRPLLGLTYEFGL